MRVLLLKDVYKLGRAGDVKKVADGYGRNYLIPQGLAALATPGMLKQAERIRARATQERERLNQELGAVAERLQGLQLVFPAKAGETGKLYGSITTTMISEAIEAETGAVVERRHIDIQPIKTIGVHTVPVRLTIDLMPEITVVVHREGEPPESAFELEESELPEAETAGQFVDLQADLEAQEALAAEEEAVADEEPAAAEEEAEAAEEGETPAVEAEDEQGRPEAGGAEETESGEEG